jgi:hypothetical protein
LGDQGDEDQFVKNHGHANQEHANQDRADQAQAGSRVTQIRVGGTSGTRSSGTQIRVGGISGTRIRGLTTRRARIRGIQIRVVRIILRVCVTQIRVGGISGRRISGTRIRDRVRGYDDLKVRSWRRQIRVAPGLIRVTRIELGLRAQGLRGSGARDETHANQQSRDVGHLGSKAPGTAVPLFH